MTYNRVFLSHRGIDKETVRQYWNVLTAIGLRPWMDESDLQAGSALVRALREGMANSCAVVFFITPNFEDEGYLQSEIDEALQQQVDRGDGFRIITLVFGDDLGVVGEVPEPLKKYTWKKPKTHLEGIRCIIEALPPHLKKLRGYLPLQDIVPPGAKEVALVGQNLVSRLGFDEQRYNKFREELKKVLARKSIETVVLLMMTPKALLCIHPKAAKHLKSHSLPRIKQLQYDLPEENRIIVAFHPSATLSMVVVDWSHPDWAFSLITPKFQRTEGVDDRLSILLDERYFDPAPLTRMLLDAKDAENGSVEAPLKDAPVLLERLLAEAGL